MSLSSEQVETLMGQSEAQLTSNNKKELVNMIKFLRGRVEELTSYQLISKRVLMLEKTLVSHMQYNRRESFEIHNLPPAIEDNALEGTCLDLLEDIGVPRPKPEDVVACHRLKNKSKTIIRFVNPKNVDMALHNRAKLRNIDREKYSLEAGNSLYINESLCPPMQFLSYKARCLSKEKKIHSYNLWKGKLTFKLYPGGPEMSINHIDDLIRAGLATEEDREKFIVWLQMWLCGVSVLLCNLSNDSHVLIFGLVR